MRNFKIYFRSSLIVFTFLLVSADIFAQYNYDVILSEAKKDIANNNFIEAISKLNICLSNTRNLEAYYFRAACKYSLYDNVGAEQDFTSALTNYSVYYYDALHYRSQVRYRLSDYAGSIDDLNKVIQKQPFKTNFYIERAYAKLAGNDFNGAIADCNKAISLKAFGEDVYLCKAAAEDALANYNQAISDYDRAVKLNPGNEDAYVRRGNTRYKTEDFCGAIEDYNKALKIDTTCALAYYSRAETEVKLDSISAALRDYNKVLLYEPQNSYAYFNRGVLYSNMGKNKSAIADFDQVLILNPNNIQALSNRAKLKQNIKDFKGAINDYNKIIELYPYFMEAYYNRGKIKYNLKDLNGAKKDFETGKVMSEVFHSKNNRQLSNDSTLVANLLHLHADFNRTPKSELDTLNIQFQPLFYISEKNDLDKSCYPFFPALNKIAQQENKLFCFSNGDLYPSGVTFDSMNAGRKLWTDVIFKTNNFLLKDASEIITQIIQRDTGNAISYFQRAIIRCREVELLSIGKPVMLTDSSQNLFPELDKMRLSAIDDFTKALQIDPAFSFAYYNRGNLKCMLKDFYGALKDYEKAIQTNPNFAEAYFNMGFILYYLNNKDIACSEFSKAGELGYSVAYAFIKKYCTSDLK